MRTVTSGSTRIEVDGRQIPGAVIRLLAHDSAWYIADSPVLNGPALAPKVLRLRQRIADENLAPPTDPMDPRILDLLDDQQYPPETREWVLARHAILLLFQVPRKARDALASAERMAVIQNRERDAYGVVHWDPSGEWFSARLRCDLAGDLREATRSLASALSKRERYRYSAGSETNAGGEATVEIGKVVTNFNQVELKDIRDTLVEVGEVLQVSGWRSVLRYAIESPAFMFLVAIGLSLSVLSFAFAWRSLGLTDWSLAIWCDQFFGRLGSAFFAAGLIAASERAVALLNQMPKDPAARYVAVIRWTEEER